MKKEDLIKKLENIKTPEIEIQSHKERLKVALLTQHQKLRFGTGQDSGYFWNKIMLRRLVPAGITLALILVVGFTVIQPKLQIAKAMEIAKKDPQIQQLMKDYGVEIKEVKLQDGKAFVLLALPEEKLPPVPALTGEETDSKKGMRGPGQFFIAYRDPKTGEIIESSGSVAEIDLKADKVVNLKQIGIVEPIEGKGPAIGKYTGELKKIETIINVAPLTEEEKAKAIEIAKSEPKIKEMIPDLDQREVIVKPLPPLKLRLDEDPDNGMEVTSADPNEEKRVNVIFKSDKMQDIITVNLTTGRVEGAVSYSTSRIERSQSEYPHPIYPIKPKFYLEPEGIETSLPGEGEVRMYEGQLSGPESATEKEMFAAILKEIAEKDDRIKDLLKDNDYEILEIIRSKPIVEKTETSETIRIETTTVVLEKESTGEDYWITIDMGTMTVKSIEKTEETE